MNRSWIRGNILDFEPYSPGLSIDEIQEKYGLSVVIKLASNENPLGVSPRVGQVLKEQWKAVHRYPQAGSPRLRQALADYHGIPVERVVAGNGSDEIIDLLIRVVADPRKDHVLALRPSFSIYRLQSKLCDVAFRQIDLREDFTFPLQELLGAVNENTAMVFLTTPDNPSGFAPTAEEVLAFYRDLPKDCLLVLDEAYMDFAVPQDRYSLLSLAGQASNLVVLRTFSKLYGLAGLRLGYGLMPEELADYHLRVKLPFSVNVLAEKAGLAALQDHAFRRDTLDTVVRGREELSRILREWGFQVYPSQANFILVKPPMPAAVLFERLLRRGIIIRQLLSYGLKDHLRITIGNANDHEQLLAAIRDILGQ
jgi:histidinol-phosphate aminotransferase